MCWPWPARTARRPPPRCWPGSWNAPGLQPGFLVGGVPLNFGVSARLGAGSECRFVIEADEYDTAFFDKRSKFVHYRPRTAILNNLEFDHADIFDDLRGHRTAVPSPRSHRSGAPGGVVVNAAGRKPGAGAGARAAGARLRASAPGGDWQADGGRTMHSTCCSAGDGSAAWNGGFPGCTTR